jgi:type II secretory pathway predicted ATPase ExeA
VYEGYFALSYRPFVETVSPAAYVALPGRDAVLRRLRYGLTQGHGPAVLFGPPGSGKTLLARTLAADLGLPTVHLTFPTLSAAEFLTLLAEEFVGPLAAIPTMAVALRRVRNHLAAAAGRAHRPLLIVDEAQLIEEPGTFETLRLLLNFASTGPPDLALLLVGTAELILRLPPGLADRLTCRCLLAPFTESESSAYVLGRLAAAGAAAPLFTPEALEHLHRAADGLPRRLNHLADLALLLAYSKGNTQANVDAVAIAARELQLDSVAA